MKDDNSLRIKRRQGVSGQLSTHAANVLIAKIDVNV